MKYPEGGVGEALSPGKTQGNRGQKNHYSGDGKNFGRIKGGAETVVQIAAKKEKYHPQADKGTYLPRIEAKSVSQTENHGKIETINPHIEEKRGSEDKISFFHVLNNRRGKKCARLSSATLYITLYDPG